MFANVDELGAPNVGMVMELVENWADEVFVVAGRLLPVNLPLLKDEKFLKDRERYWVVSCLD